MQSRLSAGEANPIDPTLKGMKTLEDFFWGYRSKLPGMKDEGMVMTVWTTEVAAGEEEDRTDFPRPVQKGSF